MILQEFEIQKGKKLTGSPSLQGDFILASHSTLLAALSEGHSTLENIPRCGWFEDLKNTLVQLGYAIEWKENQLDVQGAFRAPDELEKPIVPQHELVLMALGGLFAGFKSKNKIAVDFSRISRFSLKAFLALFDCKLLEEESQESRPVYMVQAINPIKLEKYPQREYLLKIGILYYHACSKIGLEINCSNSGPNHLEKIISNFCEEVVLTGDQEPEMSEFEKRLAKKMGQSPKSESLFILPSLPKFKGSQLKFPNDISLASVYILAATLIPGSSIVLENVLLNPSRTSFLTALRRMGANIEVTRKREKYGESFGDLKVVYSELKGRKFAYEALEGMRDEIPLLIIATAFAEGESVIRDITFLRQYEQDLLKQMIQNLKEISVDIGEMEDGLVIRGKQEYDGHTYNTLNNAMIGFAYMILGLKSHGKTIIQNTECMEHLFPGVIEKLKLLAAA